MDPVKAKRKYERFRAKYERKIKRILPKIRALTIRRSELKDRRVTKG